MLPEAQQRTVSTLISSCAVVTKVPCSVEHPTRPDGEVAWLAVSLPRDCLVVRVSGNNRVANLRWPERAADSGHGKCIGKLPGNQMGWFSFAYKGFRNITKGSQSPCAWTRRICSY